ncbi:MAG TPA: DegV family protein [Candidatus Butyricicoccus avistercoris]|uniref:DegV family protein n=1 Tax=Candidatus Butyricicoccus avistercoris TaxID=2838518 RepID=A0A9D1PHH2_9FIRM|nr:DegV family protein [Candidatus Butyricicoccus avistercoris]
MNKIALLTDSCADIPKDLKEKYDIYVVPLKIRFGDEEYLDGVTITPDEVYERQKTELPKTSLPDGAWIEDTFDKIKNNGYEKVIAVHLSGGISGTFNLVRLLAADYEGLEISVFDSISGSLGIGLIVLQLAKYIEKGYTYEKLVEITPKLIQNTTVFFCVDTLEFLQKGGRIGKISAMAGTLLQIKPILTFAPDGQLTSAEKVRGRKLALEKMAQKIEKLYSGNGAYNIAVANGGCVEEMNTLKDRILGSLCEPQFVFESEIDCTLASYVGPNLLGIGLQILPE